MRDVGERTRARRVRALIATSAVLLLVSAACGPRGDWQRSGAPARLERSLQCAEGFNPSWRQAAGANRWWVEFYVDGGEVSSAHLDVLGAGSVELNPQWGKWVGGAPFAIDSGSDVRLRATNADGAAAESAVFRYLVDETPVTDCEGACVPACEGECGSDGCGGSCGTCAAGASCIEATCVVEGGALPPEDDEPAACSDAWRPTFTEGSGANEWWVEYVIDGDVSEAYLQLPQGRVVPLVSHYGKWAGLTGERLAPGTLVTVHATSSTGEKARTVSFPYLEEPAPETALCTADAPVEDPPDDPAPDPEAPACAPIDNGLLTIQFDDNSASQYTLARPALVARGLFVEQVLVVEPFVAGWPDYLTIEQAKAFVADGGEIVAHGVTHTPLSTLSRSQVEQQMRDSRAWLEANLGTSVPHYAAPDGEFDADGMELAPLHFDSYRGGYGGLNLPGSDRYALKADVVYATTTPAEVAALIDEAGAEGGWRILIFHRFTTGTPDGRFPPQYNLQDFEEILDYALASGVEVVTTEEGLARVSCSP